jgi:hypothetical protein
MDARVSLAGIIVLGAIEASPFAWNLFHIPPHLLDNNIISSSNLIEIPNETDI